MVGEDKFLNYTRNLISIVGAILVTASAMLFLAFFGMELVGLHAGPYLGIISYLIVPGIFIFGLLLIPIGAWFTRRKARRNNTGMPALPVVDLNQTRTRRGVLVFVALTVINVVILGLAAYKGVEVMDSTSFCGKACHVVMAPEFTAYQRSAHARVSCTECHIGPGAPWFVKSKLSGAWQLVAVSLDLYPRPIPTPVKNLRPARETCEACHWPEKFVGDKLKINTHFTDDEETKATKNVLLVHVGGQGPQGTKGIHWHVDPQNQIRFLADAKREVIRDVEMKIGDAPAVVYKAGGDDAAKPAEGPLEWRSMDCVDCHNRPTHIYSTPEKEIDAVLANGEVDRTLPFIRREGLKALKADYASAADAKAKIAEALTGFWAKDFAEKTKDKKASIDKAIATLTGIWETHVFPGMKIKWGTYPSHLGHQETAGCFRCHNDQHATADGKVISQKCATCHRVLAEEEEDPEVLQHLHIK